jgi:hypothetical protein
MERVRLQANVQNINYCCGLEEVGPLDAVDQEGPWDYHDEDKIKRTNDRKALFATTVPHQKEEVKRLKALGFRKITSWRNKSTKNQVTLWFKKPKGQRW